VQLRSPIDAMTKETLLIVEDDPGLCRQYRWAFPGRTVVTAHTRSDAIEAAQRDRPQVAIVDLGLPPDPDGISEGLATLATLVGEQPRLKAIVATGHSGRDSAVLAVTRGAHDFFEKPVDINILRIIVDRAFRLHEIETENEQLRQIGGDNALKRVITTSDAMFQVCRDIQKLAATDVPILLLGESGTGKDVLARSLHELSDRADGPFIAINCGAIPENLLESELFGHERGAFTGAVRQSVGRIEIAQGGTLFLDEIGDLPMSLQVKLLRFLQEHVIERVGGRLPIPVDVRVVSATNQDLTQLIESGRFRLDLFYRLNIVSVTIPPLRDRAGDPVLLARYFLGRFGREAGRAQMSLSDAAIAALDAHDWPGNVRELENRVRRASIMAGGSAITPEDLGLRETQTPALDLRMARQNAERDVIQQALSQSGGSISKAARILNVQRPTLYALINGLGIDKARFAMSSDDAASPVAIVADDGKAKKSSHDLISSPNMPTDPGPASVRRGDHEGN